MRYKWILNVPADQAAEMERICREPDASVEGDGVEFDEEVVFEDGMRMAIQVCASGNPAEESCWTQGVLFDQHGNEAGCTDVGESFLGEYCIASGEHEYVVVVQVSDVPSQADLQHIYGILDDAVMYLRGAHVAPGDESTALAESVEIAVRRLRTFTDPQHLSAVILAAHEMLTEHAAGRGVELIVERTDGSDGP